AVYALPAAWILRRRHLTLPRLGFGLLRGLAVFAVFTYSVITTWGASEQILGGQDPGLYVALAGNLNREGTLHHRNEALASLPLPVLERIVEPAIAHQYRIILSGLYVDSQDPARVNPQFIHGLPALMATFKAAFGLMGMLRVPVLMGLLSV